MNFSLKDRHIIVCYHYVCDPNKEFSGIFPCPVAEFEKQVKFLSGNYRISSVADVVEAARKNSDEKVCAITFDDGTIDQFQNALPVLEKHKTTATFFVIAGVLKESFLPSVHKTHILLSKVDIAEVVDEFNNFLQLNYPSCLNNLFVPKDKPLSKTKRNNYGGDFRISNFKEKLTSASVEVRDGFLKFIFEKNNISEKDWVGNLFMGRKEVEDLMKRDFLIGGHTYSHLPVDVLEESKIDEELKKSNECFDEMFNFKPIYFSYPWGRSSDAAKKVLKENGFKYAVIIERRGILEDDGDMALPRYDANDVRDFLNL